jgi:hypothetical protein
MRSIGARLVTLSSSTVLAALACAGCVSATEASGAAPAAQVASGAPSELVRLRTHDGDVAILAGGGGRRVTIYDANGAPIVQSADIESLRATRPDVVQLLTTSVASHTTYVDARLYDDDTSRATPAPAGEGTDGAREPFRARRP